jgi:hypothetical protein
MSNKSLEEIAQRFLEAFEKGEISDSPPIALSHEEKEERLLFLQSFLDTNAKELGTFIVTFSTSLNSRVEIIFSTLDNPEQAFFPQAKIYENGIYKGTTCSMCKQRVKCLTQSFFWCLEKDENGESLKKEFSQKFSFALNQDFLHSYLQKEGFTNVLFLGVEPIDTMFEKNGTYFEF